MKLLLSIGAVLALISASATAQNSAPPFPPEQVKQGAALYAKHCAACHGARMVGPEWAIDLKTFPKDERPRFVDSVTHGKAGMPPWGDVLKPDDIAALWTYVVTGEAK
ncbi:MAG: cytochrome c55X [Betaproteobacteria bacterium]|nr:cytochrome c55X [Betaproteobacteria bacterium]